MVYWKHLVKHSRMEEIMIKEMVTEEFLAELSSKKPTPGGGGAAALGST